MIPPSAAATDLSGAAAPARAPATPPVHSSSGDHAHAPQTASALPARRAAAISPIRALRVE